ncbi:patellin-4 [Amborella trichopoda]|uniref:CRAL-TRIO domain-containing protein n=1 Tax=Amborella trichopoda TaxID=13333 RepID=U5DBE5_AMBTC|nr:patellin-4 [Amborella trichopoda]ERN18752.1 hypothetical protein AMTR_s00067p00033540 [Amborella trichopoda]|eukprot:XP_006857285.1 patellin-4 [Amborella trichopoda]
MIAGVLAGKAPNPEFPATRVMAIHEFVPLVHEIMPEKLLDGTKDDILLPDLKPSENRALMELRAKLEDAIVNNRFPKPENDWKNATQYVAPIQNTSERTQLAKLPGESKNSKIIENKGIELWGVPLLPSLGHEGADIILMKFLKARDFKASEAFDMLWKTLIWRKEFRIDDALDEEYGEGLESVAYMNGTDRKGHPICYNSYGAFHDKVLYQKAFGSEENCEKFMRWRFQFLEKSIKKLKFKAGEVHSMLQITDLKNSPGPSKKELRAATKKAILLLQDNYPELVAKNVFVNVPFWYYAFNAVLSTILTQRTTSKFIFARPSRVMETLLKFIAPEDIPIKYGGFKRENDEEFSSINGAVSKSRVKGRATETIQFHAPMAGFTFVWDVTVVGGEVSYKEEFIPEDEGSYIVLIQKEKKITTFEEPIRNSFHISEPGKVVITIDNSTFWKKKILYRTKSKRTVIPGSHRELSFSDPYAFRGIEL